jgi:hypothetical protein
MNSTTHTPSLSNLLRGRDLAVEMLREAQRVDETSDRSIRADEREAVHQANFARQYLQRLIADPTLLDGFAAVLTDALGFCGGLEPERYATLKLRDIVEEPVAR